MFDWDIKSGASHDDEDYTSATTDSNAPLNIWLMPLKLAGKNYQSRKIARQSPTKSCLQINISLGLYMCKIRLTCPSCLPRQPCRTASKTYTFRNARPTLRKWAIPPYARKSAFPAYESQLKLVFEDAKLIDVALGRAIRTVPADEEAPSETVIRAIYYEWNFQIHS